MIGCHNVRTNENHNTLIRVERVFAYGEMKMNLLLGTMKYRNDSIHGSTVYVMKSKKFTYKEDMFLLANLLLLQDGSFTSLEISHAASKMLNLSMKINIRQMKINSPIHLEANYVFSHCPTHIFDDVMTVIAV